MKIINKTVLLLFMAVAVISIYSSCKKDDVGEPRIKYVRITTPESSDSLLVGAGQGQLVAIVGENLQSVTEIWFNDHKAVLTPTYITSTSILVRVPTPLPTDITNKAKLIFADGRTLLHDFEVQVSAPIISNMVSEYVNTGEVATIRGDYFYAPLTVTFTGDVTGEVVSIDPDSKILQVKVPDGAEPGPVTITTNFGEEVSDFWFRDNRNIFISSDPYSGWWRESFVVTNPGPNDPPKINGNYIRVNQTIAGWAWTEVAGGPASAMGAISKSIPDAAILKPSDYYFKFEVNTMKPYNNNLIKFNVGLPAENNNGYAWAPPYDTKGQWQTVVIPYEEVVASYGTTLSVQPDGYWTRILMHGGGELNADISFDNLRVVPKVLK